MTLLIIADSQDMHANTVQQALESHDVRVLRLASDRLPLEQTLTHVFEQGRDRHDINRCSGATVETIWLRRRGQPSTFPTHLDAVDDDISRQESSEFWKFCQFALPERARCVNPLDAKLRAQSKIYQLRMARLVGLPIPATIVSNDPDEVQAFAARAGTVAFKTLSPVHWKEASALGAQALHALFTTRVSARDLVDHMPALRYAPGIFQELIQAVREYRITMFGAHCISVTVTSEHAHDNLHDWRAGRHDTVQVRPASIPIALRERLQRFMTACQLAFGAFDILETADGQFYFLEVNEAGQFLWIEQSNPEVSLLKPFCDFLIGRSDMTGTLCLADITMPGRHLESAS